MFFVYTIRSSLDDKVFYVGKGCGNRFYAHRWRSKNGSKFPVHCKIRKIWELGGDVLFEKIFESEDEGLVYQKERHWIAFYGRENLMNLTDGGDVAPTGMKHSSETLKKFSDQRKGRRHTPEAIEKMRDASRARWYSRPLEVRKKILEAATKASILVNKNRSKEEYSKISKSVWDKRSPEERKMLTEKFREAGSMACIGRIPWNKGMKFPFKPRKNKVQ